MIEHADADQFTDSAEPAGDLDVFLGMLDREDYRRGWEWKRDWYERNGIIPGVSLFASEEGERGALDSQLLKELALKIKKALV